MLKHADPDHTKKARSPSRVSAAPTVSAHPSAHTPFPGRARSPASGLAFPVQCRTVVGNAADAEEVEAERVARSVVQLLRGAGGAGTGSGVGAISRRALQDAVIGPAGGEVDGETASVLRTSAGRGTSIPATLRGELEGALRVDLSGVRLHAGAQAAALNRGMLAAAFTHGRDIYFRDGLPDTGTDRGLHLLAHELTHTVQQGTSPASGSPGRPAVIQRRLFVDGEWYGAGDEEKLEELKKQRDLPGWLPDQLTGERTFALDEEGGAPEWKEVSSGFLFYRHKPVKNDQDEFTYPRQAEAKVGALGDVLAQAGVRTTEPTEGEPKDPKRVGPRHPLRRTVSRVRLFQMSTARAGHWTLECEVDGGEGAKTGVKNMKIDLTNAGYRIFYGGQKQAPTRFSQEVSFELEDPTPVLRLYEAFVRIAQQKGPRTGTSHYNCQDFALAMLRELKVKQKNDLAGAMDDRERKRSSS